MGFVALTLIADPDILREEAKLMLRDHSLRSFLTDEERVLFDGVQMWVETCPMSTGFEVLLNPHAPIIAARQTEYFFTRESRRQFIRIVKGLPVNGCSRSASTTTCLPRNRRLRNEDSRSRKLTPVNVPFFSRRDRIGMMLVEVRIPQDPEARGEFESAWMKGAFPTSVYREEIVALDRPIDDASR